MLDSLKRFKLWLSWVFSFSQDDFSVFAEKQQREVRRSFPSVDSKRRAQEEVVTFSQDSTEGTQVSDLGSEDEEENQDADFGEKLKLATDFSSLLELFSELSEVDHPLTRQAFDRLLLLADTVDLATELFENAPQDSVFEEESVRHFAKVATSLEECNDFLSNFDLPDTLREIVDARLLEIFEGLVSDASDLERCLNLYEQSEDAGFSDEIFNRFVEKCLDFVEKSEDCDRILECLFDTSEPPDTPLEESVYMKKVSLLDSVEACSEVWEEQGIDSAIGEAAICRAAEIIGSR